MKLRMLSLGRFRGTTSRSMAFVGRALGLIRDASGRWMVAWAFVLGCGGLLPAANVFLMKRVVDALARSVGAGATWEQATAVLIPAALMLAVMVAQRALSAFGDLVNTIQAQLVQDHIKGLIHEKAATIDFGFFESPEYHDQMHQANSQAGTRILSLLGTLGGLTQSAITFVSISAILVRYSVWLPLLLLITGGPAFYLLLKQNRRYHAWWKDTTADRRRSAYLDLVLTSQVAAAEIRLYRLGEYFTGMYRDLVGRMRGEALSLTRERIVAKIIASCIGIVVTGFAVLWIGRRALRGRATLGDLALFYQAFNQGQALAGGLLSGMGDIHTSILYLEQVFEYLDTVSVITDPESPTTFPSVVAQGVAFEDVSFTYDGSDHPAVERLSLHIPAGKIVALVGANGSGKSTLIKLLCRFYDPGAGRVTIDGIDLRRFRQEELRRQIAVMMQFPMKYHLSVGDNIRLGDLASGTDAADIGQAARGAGAHEFIERLPARYETLLGRTFKDSTELSGGEWQRLALARAFYRQAQIVVLDEPTSFMDSWNEHEWLHRFRSLVANRTALIITHRFTTAMQADIIHVMERGRIVESGTHAELLDLGGRYAESWMEQMKSGARTQPLSVTVSSAR